MKKMTMIVLSLLSASIHAQTAQNINKRTPTEAKSGLIFPTSATLTTPQVDLSNPQAGQPMQTEVQLQQIPVLTEKQAQPTPATTSDQNKKKRSVEQK